MVFLLLFVAPALWVLAARNPELRGRILVSLAIIGVAQFVVGMGWLLPHAQRTLMVSLTLLGIAVLIVGLKLDRVPAAEAEARVRIGRALVIGYCVFAVCYGGGGVAIMVEEGAIMPDGEFLMPLPDGLVLLAQSEGTCGGGSTTYCVRYFTIDSAVGSETGVAERVTEHLTEAHDWVLEYRDGWWGGCRTHGWRLDRQDLCVSVTPGQGEVEVRLSSSAP